tara:strand:+ start:23425 stop:23643 length:219 start_codon:yes stop_codon:yes gene_type:complete
MNNELNVSSGSVIIFNGAPIPELGDLLISFSDDGYEFWDFIQSNPAKEEDVNNYFCDVCGIDYDTEDPCPFH